MKERNTTTELLLPPEQMGAAVTALTLASLEPHASVGGADSEITAPGNVLLGSEDASAAAPAEARHHGNDDEHDQRHGRPEETLIWGGRSQDEQAGEPEPQAGGSGGDNTTPPYKTYGGGNEYNDDEGGDSDQEPEHQTDEQWAEGVVQQWSEAGFLQLDDQGRLVGEGGTRRETYPMDEQHRGQFASAPEGAPDIVGPEVYGRPGEVHPAHSSNDIAEDIGHVPKHSQSERFLERARRAVLYMARAEQPGGPFTPEKLDEMERRARALAAIMEARPAEATYEAGEGRRNIDLGPQAHDTMNDPTVKLPVMQPQQQPEAPAPPAIGEITADVPVLPGVAEPVPQHPRDLDGPTEPAIPPQHPRDMSTPAEPAILSQHPRDLGGTTERMTLPENPTTGEEIAYWESNLSRYEATIAELQQGENPDPRTLQSLEQAVMLARGELERLERGQGYAKPDQSLEQDDLQRVIDRLRHGLEEGL